MKKIDIIQIVTILFWISFLECSDSYFTPYLVVAILAFLCFYNNKEDKSRMGREKENSLLSVSAGIFSLMVLAANYQMLSGNNLPDNAGILFKSL